MIGRFPISASISMLFRELPLLERFEAARSHDFDGVEIQDPYTESADALSKAAGAAGMPVVLINSPIVPSEHPYGIAGRPELTALFQAQITQAAEYAEALGATFVHVLAGSAPAGRDRERYLRTYEENLIRAAEKLGSKGICILIEPLNPFDVPGYLLDSFDLARSMLSRCPTGIRMQFDAYHVARMGLDLVDQFNKSLPYVRHVQFADAPGRHEPGTGNAPLTELLETIRTAQYAGWLGAEYFPSGSTHGSLGWLVCWRTTMGCFEVRPE